MDILIKGMEMPKDCYDCKFLLANYDEAECQVTCYFCFLKKGTICEGDDRELAKGIKPSTCPLVALPEHGRLGDLDANRQEFMDLVYNELRADGDNYRANRIIDAYDDIPTIVEANNGTDN